jgi:hypothetical protein
LKPRVAPLVVLLTAALTAQSITVSTSGGVVRVRSAFGFIEGELLDRLRDGRSVRLDFELTLSGQRTGALIAQAKHSFNLSFDLWEERIAVTRLGSPPRSVSHLRPRDAEAWCLENLSVPRGDLGRLANDAPFWITLSYQVPDDAPGAGPDPDDTFTLRRLIDVFSRRPRDNAIGRSIQAGPFRLSN